MTEFTPMPKIARFNRECTVTEKIDGTNASVLIRPATGHPSVLHTCDFDGVPHEILAGSRTRLITPADDNYGFAQWVTEHAADLAMLGPGHHFGEWWGRRIQRGYGLLERRFSLFNTHRWVAGGLPECCHVVPELWVGPLPELDTHEILRDLQVDGSVAASGFDKPEGIVIYHRASGALFKQTLGNDGHKVQKP